MMVQNPDIVVVGPGAACIGAGLALTRLGVSHLILEAKHRVGGRAYSEASSIGHLWDHGCHWLHSADKNVLRFMAEKIGHQFSSKPLEGELQTFTNGEWTKSSNRREYVWDLLEKNSRYGTVWKRHGSGFLVGPQSPLASDDPPLVPTHVFYGP